MGGPSAVRTAPARTVPSLGRYLLATAATVLAIVSQYFLPQTVAAVRPAYASVLGDFLIVYGIPILAFALLVGAAPLRNWAAQLGRASWQGVRWYGVFTLLALFLSFLLLAILLNIDPNAVATLNKPTPVIRAAQSDPWFWVGLSFLIGAVEETIFRGWIFGYWLVRSPADWKFHAAWTSLLFAGVHVYYALTYGPVFLIPAVVLVLDGVAFAVTMQSSGGNLVAVALLHGWNDATIFLALALPAVGLLLHYLVVLAGGAIALALYLRARAREDSERALRPI